MDSLDQYYTNFSVAEKLFGEMSIYDDGTITWLEPSAGTGAFFRLLPQDRRIGYDIDPKLDGIEEADFLTCATPDRPFIAIGNPPFGKNSSTAVRFFNHCRDAAIIAMIVPRTFRKPSVINRLDEHFHLIRDEVLPAFSFVYEGQPYDVPCCFQIWERRTEVRPPIVLPRKHPDFDFCARQDGDFAVQRVGVRAGAVKTISDRIADQSHYFIKSNIDAAVLRTRFEQLDFDSVKHNTAGNPSVSKAEIVSLYGMI